jgi:hypothetical protein
MRKENAHYGLTEGSIPSAAFVISAINRCTRRDSIEVNPPKGSGPMSVSL